MGAAREFFVRLPPFAPLGDAVGLMPPPPVHVEPLMPAGPRQRRGGAMAFLLDIAPIFGWLRDYPVRSALAHDISGGVTLGCILIGQSLAHAKLCGVELIIGPYSCMLGPVLYAVFGTCIHSSIGTGALICLLVGEHVPARD